MRLKKLVEKLANIDKPFVMGRRNVLHPLESEIDFL